MLDRFADFIVNGGRRKVTKPIFIKEFSKNEQLLNELTALLEKTDEGKVRTQIERDMKLMEIGIKGEKNVAYELKNSLLPMLCLHDIRLEYMDLSIQMDFIIITRKSIIVFEAKKLAGDIEINNDGDFIRLYKNKYGKVYKREGMYSPISQNERQVRILEKILKDEKLIKRMPIKSYVILANPKTILHKNKAPKKIQENIYKYEQITNLIKQELEDQSMNIDLTDKTMLQIASFLKENHKPVTYNYESKYTSNITNETSEEIKPQINEETINNSREELVELLKQYRLEVSRKEGLKAYMIFTNKEMEDLLEANPQSKDDLLQVRGFGEIKVEKYGDRIIEIIKSEIY